MSSEEEMHERELWARFASGERLEHGERARLAAWVESEEMADAFLDDVSFDRALRTLPQLESTHEEFIERTWSRAFEPSASPARSKSGALPFAFAAASALALLASGYFLGARTHPVERELAVAGTLAPAFVTRTGPDHAGGERLGSGRMVLPSGLTELQFDDGAAFAVDGPAELEILSPSEVLIARGGAAVELPRELGNFVVRTPTSRIKDADARFRLAVLESGETELRIERGLVSLEPGRPGEWSGRVQRLSARQLSSARVRVLEPRSKDALLASEARGSRERFSGLLVAKGRVLEYGTPQVFERASRRVIEVAREKPEFFYARWKEAAEVGEPFEFRFQNGTAFNIGEVTELVQLDRLGAAIEQGLKIELRGPEGLEIPQIEIPAFHLVAQGEPLFRGTIMTAEAMQELRKDPELKQVMKIRVRALKDLGLPVD